MKSPHLYKKVYYENEGEFLSGEINGEDASDIEERFYRALGKRSIPSIYRLRINPLLGLTRTRENIIGELEIDFFCAWMGSLYPILIDGEIAHFAAMWQIEADAQKTVEINNALKEYNALPAMRIPFWKLATQSAADNAVSEIFDNVIASRIIAGPYSVEEHKQKAEQYKRHTRSRT